ncbi:MAG: ribonuclease HIII [Bacilli bacterium]|nr:ribonuclease HIII [Bacilli bacterium]
MNVVIKVNDEIKEKMIEYYKDKKRDKVIPYVVFQAQEEDTVITMYESGKVMFQGVSADVDAAMWGVALENTKEKKEENKKINKKYYNCNAVGSDEVGTGDYFGPIVVTACYVTKEDIPFLEELGVGDSKKIDDSKILKIAPQLAKRIKYKSVILTNKEYNEKYTKDINMNKIKAIMHNKALYDLINSEKPKYDYIIVDEFAREARYYEYLSDQTTIQRGITFLTKAEDISPAVGCASIISRYLFLKEFDKLADSIHIPLPKGAGKDVDAIGEEVVEKYGKDKLKEIAKVNFKNTDRILHTLIY